MFDRLALRTLAALVVLASTGAPVLAQQVVISTTGGAYERTLREHWFDPFTRATGIRVQTVTASAGEARTRIQAMVRAGNVSWDAFLVNEINAEADAHRAMAEDISPLCARNRDRTDFMPGWCTAAGVMTNYTATLIAYDGSRFAGEGPQSWADFWDVRRFPGQRAFPNFADPWRVLAAALLADGVPPDQLFPLDLERAFRRLDEIKPYVSLWWRTGDQSVQGFRAGDYALGMIWQTRAHALIEEGRPLRYTLNQAFLIGERAAVVRGAPNRENALRLIQFYIDTLEAQARICETLICVPSNREAIRRMSPAARAAMPDSDEALRRIVRHDAAWILANQERLLTAWNTWIQR